VTESQITKKAWECTTTSNTPTTTNHIPSHPTSSYSVHAQPEHYDYSQQQQQQHLYPIQPLLNGMLHHPAEEEDGLVSVSQGLSLVALGSVMGLAAAATVRWLNEFASSSYKTGTVPSRGNATPLVLEEPRTLNTKEMNGRASADNEADEAFYESEDQAHDEDDDDDGEWVHQLVEKMETLTTTIRLSTKQWRNLNHPQQSK
jgi:hypothetical protein